MTASIARTRFTGPGLENNARPGSEGTSRTLHTLRERVIAFLRGTWMRCQELEARFEARRQRRQLIGADEAMLKDLGLSRCEAEWASQHGRPDIASSARRPPRVPIIRGPRNETGGAVQSNNC